MGSEHPRPGCILQTADLYFTLNADFLVFLLVSKCFHKCLWRSHEIGQFCSSDQQFLISGIGHHINSLLVIGNFNSSLLMKDLSSAPFLLLLLNAGLRSTPAEANLSLFFTTVSSTVLKNIIKSSNCIASSRRMIQSGTDGRRDTGDKEHCGPTKPSVEVL